MLKCDKCGNEYTSKYYFAVDGICNSCFEKMSPQDQQALIEQTKIAQPDAFAPALDQKVGFGGRFGAALLDVFIWMVIYIGAMAAFGYLQQIIFYLSGNIDPEKINQLKDTLPMFQIGLLEAGIRILYFLTEIIFKASPAKMLLGYRIINQDGSEPAIGVLFQRFLIKHIDIIIGLIAVFIPEKAFAYIVLSYITYIALFFVVINCFMILGEKKLAVHDMTAKTMVVRK